MLDKLSAGVILVNEINVQDIIIMITENTEFIFAPHAGIHPLRFGIRIHELEQILGGEHTQDSYKNKIRYTWAKPLRISAVFDGKRGTVEAYRLLSSEHGSIIFEDYNLRNITQELVDALIVREKHVLFNPAESAFYFRSLGVIIVKGAESSSNDSIFIAARAHLRTYNLAGYMSYARYCAESHKSQK